MNIKELKHYATELSDSEDPVQNEDMKQVIAYCEHIEDGLIKEQEVITSLIAEKINKLLWPT